MTGNHPNQGPSLEDFLNEDGNLEQATEIANERVKVYLEELTEQELFDEGD